MWSLTASAAVLYGLGLEALDRARRLNPIPPRPVEGVSVISVGAIRAGGEGKTPLTLEIARRLTARKIPTAVVLRGYRGELSRRGARLPQRIQDRRNASALYGDEAVLFAERLPQARVYIGADRVRAVRRARRDGAAVAILDSGFQHRRIVRDLDIVCVGRPWRFTSESLLPKGRLREPPSALDRADLLVHFDDLDCEEALEPDVVARVEATALVDDDLRVTAEPGALQGRRALLLAGIARPERFSRMAGQLGLTTTDELFFADHHRYSDSEAKKIGKRAQRSGADLVLTTEKDLLRLPTIDSVEVRALRIELKLITGAEKFQRELSRVVSMRK